MTKVIPQKLLAIVAVAVALCAALALTGCSGGSTDSASEDSSDKTIKVAAVPTPHAEILNDVVKPLLEEEGYTLEVTEFTDYVQPNTATEDGEVDANYFQHGPYLENFNSERGTHLVSVTSVHYEPLAIYPGKVTSLDNLESGATVAVPNDPTNEARALLLLQQEGLITLTEGVGVNATINDIVENPLDLQIEELEAAVVPTVLADVDVACINANYAIEAGLTVNDDALAVESADGDAAQTYANLLVVKEGNENNEGIQALAKALNSDEVRDYINDNYEGSVLPVFQQRDKDHKEGRPLGGLLQRRIGKKHISHFDSEMPCDRGGNRQ